MEDLPAVAVERRVQVAAGLEAGHPGQADAPAGDDLAVGLEGDAGEEGAASIRGGDQELPVAGERRVEGAVRVVAGDGEVVRGDAVGLPDHHELAVRLE